jgi:GLPGLI family protein
MVVRKDSWVICKFGGSFLFLTDFMKYPIYRTLILIFFGLLLSPGSWGQKKIAELTLIYDYSVFIGNVKSDDIGAASHTVFIKGSKSRSEMSNALFSSTTIFDANTGSAVILKEVSGQKLLIRLNPQNWAEKNQMYEGIVFKTTGETKEIAGYRCVKATGQTKSGMLISVYYTRDIIPENRQYDPAFRTLDGLPLEYELTNGNVRIQYRVSRINLNPVPASKFDLPSSGYREMNYEESKKMNVGG